MLEYIINYLQHIEAYMDRPSLEYLNILQKKHIEKIPHENIDGIYNIPSSFEIKHLLNKYINENRGGLCFELNYSFAWLLYHLGFKIEIKLSDVQAYNDSVENNPYPTHPIIIVYIGEDRYITDVGWSDSYRHPLPLTGAPCIDVGGTGTYRVVQQIDQQYAMQKLLTSHTIGDQDRWFNQFVFESPHESMQHFTYPNGFLAAHAYTRVGPEYLFSNLFKFTKVHHHGHSTIWGDSLLVRRGHMRSAALLTTDIPTMLENTFDVTHEIAIKCKKMTRTTSAHSFFSENDKTTRILGHSSSPINETPTIS